MVCLHVLFLHMLQSQIRSSNLCSVRCVTLEMSLKVLNRTAEDVQVEIVSLWPQNSFLEEHVYMAGDHSANKFYPVNSQASVKIKRFKPSLHASIKSTSMSKV